MQSLELTLAQLAGYARQQSAEASAADLLAQVRQYIDSNGGFPVLTIDDYLDMAQQVPPANPAAGVLRLYVEEVLGFPFFSFRDSTGMIRKIVRDSVFVGKNVTANPIPEYRAVYASGSDVADQVSTVALAKADSLATMPAIGITTEAIPIGGYGRIMQVGLLENVNTNAFNEGDILYVSPTTAGLATATPPLYPQYRQEIGTILVKDPAVGSLQCVARSITQPDIAAIADPGDAGAIDVTTSGWVALETGGGETRTLAAPTFIHQAITLYFKTDLGNCAVTCATGYNQAGNTVATFDDAGDTLILEAIEVGANLRWRVKANDGVGLT